MTFIFFMLPQQATLLFIDLSPREASQYGPRRELTLPRIRLKKAS